jgi:hypothetical protein
MHASSSFSQCLQTSIAYATHNSYFYTFVNLPMMMQCMLNPFAHFLSSLFRSILKAQSSCLHSGNSPMGDGKELVKPCPPTMNNYDSLGQRTRLMNRWFYNGCWFKFMHQYSFDYCVFHPKINILNIQSTGYSA